MTCHYGIVPCGPGDDLPTVGVNDRARVPLELYYYKFLARLATGAHCACQCQASSYFTFH